MIARIDAFQRTVAILGSLMFTTAVILASSPVVPVA
jgi:hypothetical protein